MLACYSNRIIAQVFSGIKKQTKNENKRKECGEPLPSSHSAHVQSLWSNMAARWWGFPKSHLLHVKAQIAASSNKANAATDAKITSLQNLNCLLSRTNFFTRTVILRETNNYRAQLASTGSKHINNPNIVIYENFGDNIYVVSSQETVKQACWNHVPGFAL